MGDALEASEMAETCPKGAPASVHHQEHLFTLCQFRDIRILTTVSCSIVWVQGMVLADAVQNTDNEQTKEKRVTLTKKMCDVIFFLKPVPSVCLINN